MTVLGWLVILGYLALWILFPGWMAAAHVIAVVGYLVLKRWTDRRWDRFEIDRDATVALTVLEMLRHEGHHLPEIEAECRQKLLRHPNGPALIAYIDAIAPTDTGRHPNSTPQDGAR